MTIFFSSFLVRNRALIKKKIKEYTISTKKKKRKKKKKKSQQMNTQQATERDPNLPKLPRP